jgi:hypothetical protein
MLGGRRWHPIWTMLTSTLLYFSSCLLLVMRFPIAAVPLVLYGGGLGLRSVARGTLAHALTAAAGYARLLGRIATVSLCVQAAAPWIGAMLMQGVGITATLLCLSLLGLANIINDALVVVVRKSRGAKRALQTREAAGPAA